MFDYVFMVIDAAKLTPKRIEKLINIKKQCKKKINSDYAISEFCFIVVVSKIRQQPSGLFASEQGELQVNCSRQSKENDSLFET